MDTSKVSKAVKRYTKNRKVVPVAISAAILLAAGGYYWYDQNNSAYVPPQFFEARSRTGEISARIVALTSASAANLGLISAADQAGDYDRGLSLVLEVVTRNDQIRNEAIKLSEELKIMALNLGAIQPEKAAKVGLQAATSGLELVQYLINYNNHTQELLRVLQTRLANNGSPETRQKIEQLISAMNGEAKAVNELNQRYQEQMKEFDRLTS